jgi:hypothetical protein
MSMVAADGTLVDLVVWNGRRALGVLDAILWPALFAAMVAAAPVDMALIGEVALATCVVAAARRAGRAALAPHRYRFTTCRAVSATLAVLALGMTLNLTS